MHATIHIDPQFLDYVSAHLPNGYSLAEFTAYCQTPLRKSIRVNTLRLSVDEFCQHVNQQGWQLTPIPWCAQGFWIERPSEQEERIPLGNTAEHLAGWFYIQEASSMLPPVALVNPDSAPACVLDMASAPGSKSTQLAAMMNNRGTLVANELSSSRVKVLAANFSRCGVQNACISHFDGQVFGQYTQESFDAILLDAPCSGEGTVRKDPAALQHWDTTHINSIVELQTALLDAAIQALKVGGELVYSTCTLNKFENQHVVASALETYGDALEIVDLSGLFCGAEQAITPEGYLHVWPMVFDSEGFFVAKLRKVKATPLKESKSRHGDVPFSPLTRKQWQPLDVYLKSFGIDLPLTQLFYRDNEIWFLPEYARELGAKIKLQRYGVKLAQQFKQDYRLTHEASLAFGCSTAKRAIEITQAEYADFCQGKDFLTHHTPSLKGELLLCFNGQPVGLGKWVNGKIKNSLPRELVRDRHQLGWG
ncbi:16S rRNA (cytosine(1407)-C(5))-methyltransferase RsmF [Bowmanella sp. JS7-9]|uniref:16S rRNA (Cytosine(1407)-C(5))-methyltransferase RsmF n=1 Tax=Pseudobowmanella zhangzhouensis TaxID=1537679 RepID=A0ABW1XK13_9ALTE|nr:16S rRNA (cytosine(1407)-C(5))-methyltransferase RsmF [Bowmanella sp. JS7-9]TBX26070.1 hypothetical protein TK45_02405 [Bowmanella sp. JS7-9]